MSTLHSLVPTDGNGKQQDATQEPRSNAQALRDASQYLNRIADDFDEGRLDHHPVVEDQHEAECREIEALADGELEPDRVVTMSVEPADELRGQENGEPDERTGIEGLKFYGSFIQVCVDLDYRWKPLGPCTNLPIAAGGIPSVTAARAVAVAKNKRSIRKKSLSRAVVIKQRGNNMYGVKMLPTGIPTVSTNPFDDHPAVRFAPMNYEAAVEKFSERNKAVIKTMKYNGASHVKRWHLIVVPIRPYVSQ